MNTIFNSKFATGYERANKNIILITKNYKLFQTSNLREWYERHVIEPTLASFEEFQERDSEWALLRIMNLTININKCNPMRAGCRFEVLREIIIKRAVINMRSMDNACFAWWVVAALYPAKRNADRESSYLHYTMVLNFQNIEFSITLKDITKFEHLNDVSINVYAIER